MPPDSLNRSSGSSRKRIAVAVLAIMIFAGFAVEASASSPSSSSAVTRVLPVAAALASSASAASAAAGPSVTGANVTLSPDEKVIIDDFFNGSIFDEVTETLVIIVFSLLIASGFLFNSLMIVVILLSENLRRMPFNLLLLNLCVSNILLSLFCMPFTLLGLIRRGWFFGPTLCKIVPSIQVPLAPSPTHPFTHSLTLSPPTGSRSLCLLDDGHGDRL